MKTALGATWILVSSLFSMVALAGNPAPTAERGALVYQERCSICHGPFGMGDGYLPLTIKRYPSTNLTRNAEATLEDIRLTVFWGGSRGDSSPLSPPFGDELTATQLESVSQFVLTLKANPGDARALLMGVHALQPASADLGRLVFRGRCAMCHGSTGLGDGRMSKVITDPPPFDLTRSIMPAAYLEKIIREGGAPLGRSPQMPPWDNELTPSELDSVIRYLLTLRED